MFIFNDDLPTKHEKQLYINQHLGYREFPDSNQHVFGNWFQIQEDHMSF